MEATRKFFETRTYDGIPVPSRKQENKDYFGQNTEDKLVEWEKNQVLELWQKYDTDKKGVTKANLIEIMKALMEDECIIGKVPNLQEDEVSIFTFIFLNQCFNRFLHFLMHGRSLMRNLASGCTSETT